MRISINYVLLLVGLSLNLTANAWVVVSDESHLSFVSIKKNNIGESHTISEVSGQIVDGEATVTLNPNSVESRVPIRNDRMREFLFETNLYPSIVIKAQVNEILEKLKIGTSIVADLEATLNMHGQSLPVLLNVRVGKLTDKKVTVSSVMPVLIRAADFKMVEGIQKLSSLVNGLQIAESIPVSFSLVFSK